MTNCHLNSGVEHLATLPWGQGYQRIEVQFRNLGNLFHHAGQSQEDILNSSDIGGGMPAVAREKPVAPDSPNHGMRVFVCQRRDAKSHVAEDLDMHSAEAERDERPKERVGGYADHQFDSSGNHLLHEHSVHVVALPTGLESILKVLKSAFHGVSVFQIEQDTADFRLVQNLF